VLAVASDSLREAQETGASLSPRDGLREAYDAALDAGILDSRILPLSECETCGGDGECPDCGGDGLLGGPPGGKEHACDTCGGHEDAPGDGKCPTCHGARRFVVLDAGAVKAARGEVAAAFADLFAAQAKESHKSIDGVLDGATDAIATALLGQGWRVGEADDGQLRAAARHLLGNLPDMFLECARGEAGNTNVECVRNARDALESLLTPLPEGE